MDREISTGEKKKRLKKNLLKYGAILLAIAIAFIALIQFLDSSLEKSRLPLGKVDIGDINTTVNATGKVIPLTEEVLTAPINSRIKEVFKSPGERVQKDEPILLLELSAIETEYKQKLDEKDIRHSKLTQAQIQIENKLAEMDMQYKIKVMQLEQMLTDLSNEQHLNTIGATTDEKVQEKELKYNVAKLELEQLKLLAANEKKNADAEFKVQQLEYSKFEKELSETARLLRDARVLAPQSATITYINNQIGTQVSVGTPIAILADLSRFKVEAEIADSWANRLGVGAKAFIKIGNKTMEGTIVNINPASQNGVIKFIVMLDNTSEPSLRSGLQLAVHARYGAKQQVMRIPTGAFYIGPAKYSLWVIDGEKAEKRNVILGESSYEYVEVVEGLSPGETVILSGMSEYKNKSTLKIK